MSMRKGDINVTTHYIQADINAKRTRTVSKAIRRSRDTPSYSTAHRQSYLTEKGYTVKSPFFLKFAYHKPVSTPTSEHNTQYTFKSILRPGIDPTAKRTGKYATIGVTERYVIPDGNNICDNMRGTDCNHERNVCQQKVPHASRDGM